MKKEEDISELPTQEFPYRNETLTRIKNKFFSYGFTRIFIQDKIQLLNILKGKKVSTLPIGNFL